VSTLGKKFILDLNFEIYCFCCLVALPLPNTLLTVQVGSQINRHPYLNISKSIVSKHGCFLFLLISHTLLNSSLLYRFTDKEHNANKCTCMNVHPILLVLNS
jgi:hypothetical protein